MMSAVSPAGLRPFSLVVSLAAAVLAGLIAFTATSAFVTGWFVPAVVTAIAATAAAVLVSGSSRARAPVPTVFQLLFTLGAIAAALTLVRLAVFVVVPTAAAWSLRPDNPFQLQHSCVSAYFVAGQKVTEVPDVYADTLYSYPQADTTGPRKARMLGPFRVDPYEYPPPFLVGPRLLQQVAPDFFDFRRLWFAVNLLVVAVGLIAMASRVDDALGTHTLWLTPLVLAPIGIGTTFQMGNVQLAFIALPLLGMLALERGYGAIGGLLLGYATVSKLFPALLIVYLLLRRDWRSAAWTIGACAALTALTLIDVGWTPFAAFLDHLPKLLSGEAFPGLTRNPDAIAINQSVPGIVFKLRFLGGPFWTFGAARIVGWAYTVVLLWALWRLATRRTEAGREPLIWLAILILASLRSPFLPGYGTFPSVWLATLAVGIWWAAPAPRRLLFLGLWTGIAVHVGQGAASPAVNSVLTFGQTLIAFALVVLVTRLRVPEPATAPSLPPAAIPAASR
jgi:alpha-1,2-mannosyltransferase